LHFVTGGAFNGKRAWVKKIYDADDKAVWISAYEDCQLPTDLTKMNQRVLIFEGIEMWLKGLLEQYDINKVREIWNVCLDHWLAWEKAGNSRHVVVIGTDITKGIVPVESENRRWRDAAGWAYQDTAAKATRVDVIWYGINYTMK
jgi:adenosylcobinamide kinase / adenosylcobinamide-phosphate guanylyltransferase